MTKKSFMRNACHRSYAQKLLLIMKLSSILLLLFTLPAAATGYSQKNVIKVTFQNGTISDVIDAIETQSEYKVFYKTSQVNIHTEIKVSEEETTIASLLDETFKGSDLTYSQMGKIIVLQPKTGATQPVPVTITGKVINENGEPIPGVSILIKGTTTGTITDIDGRYKLSVDGASKILIFSYIGMIPQELSVGSQTVIDVVLKQSAVNLDQVVVTGYGSVKKSDITGSVSSINKSDLVKLPTQRIDQALQGKAAGVMVMNTDAAPGGNTVIRIRGLSSITGSNAALIVIDGQQGGNLSTIDPNDIESMEVLKDASSTAIFGAKGANGVILITTKAGKKGKPIVSYSYNYGVQKLRKKIDVMSAGDFARTVNASNATNDLNGVPPPFFTDQQIAEYDKSFGTDWQNEIYQVAPMQNHSLSVSGGTDNTTYFFSGGYLDQNGIVKNSKYNRFNSRMNLNSDINKWLSAGLNVSIVNSVGSAPPFGSNAVENVSFENSAQPILQAPLWSATIPVYDADGNYSRHPAGFGNPMSWNPLATALETDVNNSLLENRINGNLNFKIIKGLTLKIVGAMYILDNNNQVFSNEKTYNGRLFNGSEGEGVINTNKYKQLQNTNILTYDRDFSKHHLNLTGVYEQQIEGAQWNSTVAKGFTNVSTGLDDLGGANTVVVSSGADDRVLNSFLGRVNYSYLDKYLITASYRADGSSVFGTDNKWGYFPSVAFAWKASEESFIKDIKAISYLKFRISYGSVGSQAISPYQSLARLSSGFNYPYNGAETNELGYVITQAANPNLKWENTTSTNIGIDYGFFGGRLSGSVDVYQKKTTDLLLYRSLPLYSGLSTIIDNIGSSENKGLELAIKAEPITGKFKWSTGFNIAWNKNKILDMGEVKELQIYATSGGYSVQNLMWLRTGEPFGQMLGYKTLGCWKESERTEAAKYGSLPGSTHFEDLNKDGIIDIKDRQVIGNASPKFFYGWNNQLSYQGFDLNLFFQGVHGNNIFNEQRIRLEAAGGGTSTALLDRYSATNEGSSVPAFISAKAYQESGLIDVNSIPSVDANAQSRYMEDGSYFRLKNVILSYTFPQTLVSKAGMSKLRVFVSGTNLITITKYSGYDPEVSSFNNSDAASGIDLGNYPPAKTYTMGIEVSF